MDRKLFFFLFVSPAEEGDVTYLVRPQNNETKKEEKNCTQDPFVTDPDVEYTFIAKPYFQASHDAAKLKLEWEKKTSKCCSCSKRRRKL